MSLLRSPWLHGIHDPGGEQHYLDKPSWIVFTEEIGRNPLDKSGKDFKFWVNKGFWPIVRLNLGYGSTGTIPKKELFEPFAQRVANYVEASDGPMYWIIGNEPNLAGERPDGWKISPEDYAVCYMMCRTRIKLLAGHRGDIVMPAPIAPWNVDTGDWLNYFKKVLVLVQGNCDGIALHTYTHGHDPALITSEAKMDVPYQDRNYHFRAYQDFMDVIPQGMRSLPVLITETDQNEAWADQPNSWIQSAYKEIDVWNKNPVNQTIQALVCYRYPKYDKWHMQDKTHVLQDFESAVQVGYKSPEPRNIVAKPLEVAKLKGTVTAELLNVRRDPNREGQVIRKLLQGQTVDIFEKRDTTGDGYAWYRIGLSEWVYGMWIEIKNEIESETPVATDLFKRCLAFVLRWEGGWADDPNDVGGATMKGITIGTYTRWLKEKGFTAPTKDQLRAIPDSQVEEIYFQWYWLPSKANEMTWPMCLAQMDLAVNGGVGRAEEAFKDCGLDFWEYMVWRRDWYRRLDDFKHFGKAWINRCKDLILTAYE